MILRATFTLLLLLTPTSTTSAPASAPALASASASSPAACTSLITLAVHATCHTAEARVAPALAHLADLHGDDRATCLTTLAQTPADDRGLIHVVLGRAFADEPSLATAFRASPDPRLRAAALDALARLDLPRASIRAFAAPHLLDPSADVRARARLALRSAR